LAELRVNVNSPSANGEVNPKSTGPMAQLTAQQLAEIEAACEQCSTGIGPQRAEAEAFVVGLRSAENAVDVAQFIIGSSQSDNACFHAAIMLKEATLRDW
jgi:hypothetical protein